ncbi:hypothetical protein MKW92_018047 [Papaver armeniacum]|nr:hypothetical protein MKW92_018047 [Papaver armeniacum]
MGAIKDTEKYEIIGLSFKCILLVQVLAMGEAVKCVACTMMSQLSGHGVKLDIPSLIKGTECLLQIKAYKVLRILQVLCFSDLTSFSNGLKDACNVKLESE